MRVGVDKDQKNRSKVAANEPSQATNSGKATPGLADNRPEAVQLRKLAAIAGHRPQGQIARHSPANKQVPAALPVQRAPFAVQRVKEPGLRAGIDVRVDALKERTSLILARLQEKGQSWKNKWGATAREKVKEKATQIVNREKGESLESKIVKKIWSELSTEDKIAIVQEGARLAAQGFVAAVRNAPAPEPSLSSREPSRRERTGRSSDTGVGRAAVEALGSLNALTSEDLETAYEIIKARRKINQKIDEAKRQIIDTAAGVGETVGAEAGEMRDIHEFKSLISTLTDEFEGARIEFEALKRQIVRNGDVPRYNQEMYWLQQALAAFDGPRVAFYTHGNLTIEARLAYPDWCDEARREIRSSRRDTKDVVPEDRPVLRNLTDTREIDFPAADSSVEVALETAAAAIKHIVRQDWGKVTRGLFISAPKGVRQLRDIDTGLGGKDYLDQVKLEAANFGAGGKRRNTEVTAPFYKALVDLKVNDATSLKNTARVVTRLEGTLANVGND